MIRLALLASFGLLLVTPAFAQTTPGGQTAGQVADHLTNDAKRAGRHMKKDARRLWQNPNPKTAYRGMKKNAKQAHRHLVKDAKKAGLAQNPKLRRANDVVVNDAKRANRYVKKQGQRYRANPVDKATVDRVLRRDGKRLDNRFKRYGKVSGLDRSPRVRKGYKKGRNGTIRGYKKARRRAR